jgi:hypothetical protein
MRKVQANTSLILVTVSILIVTFLPALYVLSLGPAALLLSNGWLSEKGYFALYYPLLAYGGQTEVSSEFLNWYLGLWGGL